MRARAEPPSRYGKSDLSKAKIMKPLGTLILMTAICITVFMVFTAVSPALAQQGNLPVPVQKLAPYPPVVCVTPNWAPKPLHTIAKT
jgi:hypothetical protein